MTQVAIQFHLVVYPHTLVGSRLRALTDQNPVNTPTNVLIALAVAGRTEQRARVLAVAFGGLAPDLPILIFYAWHRLIGTAEEAIWETHYYQSEWQAFIDTFNSAPLLLTGLVVAWRARLDWWFYVFIGSLVHIACDLPVHHDDAHRHLFPFSDWRFASPVSYWDPQYHGDVFFPIELGVAVALAIWLWRRYVDPVNKAVIGVTGAILAVYLAFVVLVWM